MDNSTKPCPFCGEEIKAAAVKCRFCKQMLDDAATDEYLPEKSEEKKSGGSVFSGLLTVSAVIWLMFQFFNSCSDMKFTTNADPVKIAEKKYLASANNGDTHSQTELAMYYFMCDQKDKAVEFLRKAAKDSQNAKLYLAMILMDKTSTPAEKKEGLKFLQELADAGMTTAKIRLGILYISNNDFVALDFEKGFSLLAEAKTAYDNRQFRVKIPSFDISPWFLEIDLASETIDIMNKLHTDITHFKKFCYFDEAECSLYLGLCYRDGTGTYRDHEKGCELIDRAIEIYKKGAETSPLAQYKLGICFYYGIGVDEDQSKGMELIKKAAKEFYIAENFIKELENEKSK